MVNKTLEDFGRRDLDFKTPKVVEVLPDYFKEDAPKLIQLLEAYNDFLDSEGGFNDELRNVLKARDVDGVSLEFLNFILEEVGLGITQDQFVDPREVTRNFPDFFRYKGSLFSAQGFFRALYGEEVEISYPKDQIFIVGESQLGPESLRFIQNGALYQTLSILVKSSRPISQWRDLYKRYVHPAGFFLGGEVLAEGIVCLDLEVMPDAVLDSDAGTITLSQVTTVPIEAISDPLTILIQSPDSAGVEYRANINKSIDNFDSATLIDATTQYSTVFDMSDVNQPRFSDSVDSPGVDWSNSIERFDQSLYTFMPDSSNWILLSGFWNDSGEWEDISFWVD